MNNNLHLTDAELARLEPVVSELEKKWDKEKEASSLREQEEKEKIILNRIRQLRQEISEELLLEKGRIFRDSVLFQMVKLMPTNP